MPDSWAKDPQDVLDFTIDYFTLGWLGSDTIVTSTWTVPTGITKVLDTKTTTTTTIWLSGGTVGETYQVINHIVTDSIPARQRDKTLTFSIKQR